MASAGGNDADAERTSRNRPGGPDRWPAQAATPWWMVGTAVYQVGCSSSSQDSSCWGSPGAAQDTLAPAVSEASTPATSPWMWNSGITAKQQSARVNPRVRAVDCAEAIRLRWLNGTSLGRDVVPEVASSSATSGVIIAARGRGSPTRARASVMVPAGAPGGVRNSNRVRSRWTASRRSGVSKSSATSTADGSNTSSAAPTSVSVNAGASGAYAQTPPTTRHATAVTIVRA